MDRLFVVVRVLALVLLIFALTMLLPLGFSLWLEDGAGLAYIKSMAVTITSGIVMYLGTRQYKREMQVRDGFLLVAMAWSMLAVFATLPLLFFLPELSFTDAFFETSSGLTTTGATVLSGLDSLPFSINLWRTQLVWLGGMGLIVLAVAILPLLGVGGRQMLKAEMPGPMKENKLTPRIAETAKGLWLIYAGITILCFFALKLAGMSWPDALIHAFSTMGLGGLSSHDASFGYWNSPLIESVTVIFMLIAGINFSTHFLVWRTRQLSHYRYDPEAALFIVITLSSCAGIAVYLWHMGVYPDLSDALRYATFNTVSIATTTGYSSTDFNAWPVFAPLWMLFLCTFATSSGSTGGGIKMIRARILTMQVFQEMTRLMHPQAVSPTKLGSGGVVSERVVLSVLAFLFVYVVSTIFVMLILTLSGLDLITAFSAAVACINNTGPGLNQVGPATTYAVLSDFQTWVCSFTMLLGRLELFTLLVVFNPAFWKK